MMDANKPFACDICTKSFKTKASLTTHRRIHTGEKPYECEICKRTFSHCNALDNHKRIHTGEKPYECVICKKTFRSSSDLARHTRVHTGEKPYECEICKKTYRRKGDLTNHTRLHTGEKPFSCDVCQKSYYKSSVLSYHNNTAAHIERMKCKNENIPITQSSFVDCVESIKEEIKEEESFDDPLSNQEDRTESESQNIVTELKEEVIDDAILFVQEIYNFGDEENNTVVDEIDIVEHKIEIDN